jgi:hypothetical protein
MNLIFILIASLTISMACNNSLWYNPISMPATTAVLRPAYDTDTEETHERSNDPALHDQACKGDQASLPLTRPLEKGQ